MPCLCVAQFPPKHSLLSLLPFFCLPPPFLLSYHHFCILPLHCMYVCCGICVAFVNMSACLCLPPPFTMLLLFWHGSVACLAFLPPTCLYLFTSPHTTFASTCLPSPSWPLWPARISAFCHLQLLWPCYCPHANPTCFCLPATPPVPFYFLPALFLLHVCLPPTAPIAYHLLPCLHSTLPTIPPPPPHFSTFCLILPAMYGATLWLVCLWLVG